MFSNLFGPSIPQINPVEVQSKLAQQPRTFLLDVRQPEEYQAGHISGAKLIPLPELTQRLKELPQDQEIICVCQSGSRSQSATRHLLSAGYTVINLNGGMDNWERSGLPVKKGSS